MRLDLSKQQTLLEEGHKMPGLDIIAVLTGSRLEVGLVEHREGGMVQAHFTEVLVNEVVDLVALENYAHSTILKGAIPRPIKSYRSYTN